MGMSKLGAKLKRSRKELGLTGKEVGVKVDCHLSLISAYELGKRNPSLRMLQKLAKLYELPYLELLDMLRKQKKE